jgi:hypothetical protein
MLFPSFSEERRGISFNHERIEATVIACDTLEIRGTYFFENTDSLKHTTSIYYPFPVDSIHDYPFFIELKRSSGKIDSSYVAVEKGIRWRMSVGAGEIDSIVVTYRQKTDGARGRYILTTTRFWGKPLEHAAFTVTVPDRITLTYWSFTSDTLYTRKGRLVYSAQRTDFLPGEDMLMKWECPAVRASGEVNVDKDHKKK